MTDRVEQYSQDRLGNVRREVDEILGRDGDVTTVAAADTGNDIKVYTLPSDVQEVHLEKIYFSDLSGSAATFTIKSATLDSSGNVDTSTTRTVTYNVSSDSDKTFDFVGKPFDEDAIVVNTDSNAEVAVGVYADAKEYHENQSEQTTVN